MQITNNGHQIKVISSGRLEGGWYAVIRVIHAVNVVGFAFGHHRTG